MTIDEAIKQLTELRELSELGGETPIIGPETTSHGIIAVGLKGFELFESKDCVAIQLVKRTMTSSPWWRHDIEFRPGDVCQVFELGGIWRDYSTIRDESDLNAAIRLCEGDYFGYHMIRPYRIVRTGVGVIYSSE